MGTVQAGAHAAHRDRGRSGTGKAISSAMMTIMCAAKLRLIVAACALLLACGSQPVAAPLASALGAEAPLAEPSGGYVGRLKVAPEHGPSGTPLTVTAEGLPPEQEFDLVWRTVKGRWKVADAEYHGREYEPVAYRIAKVRSEERRVGKGG